MKEEQDQYIRTLLEKALSLPDTGQTKATIALTLTMLEIEDQLVDLNNTIENFVEEYNRRFYP